jgi:light-regulated signal transduction histidine kinase (bacteriophytochrome)
MNILIVDDNEINRKLLRVTLQEEGFTIVEAADGLEAMEMLEKDPVDGVISDVLMPRMDGYRLCHKIRTEGRWKEIPFIFYTMTFLSAADAKLSQDVGADRFLKKPASVEDIVRSFEELWKQRGCSKGQNPSVTEKEILEKYNERIFIKLEERNAELQESNEKLRKRTEQLEKANQELEQFIFIASHDLQEPLRKVLAFSHRFSATLGEKLKEPSQGYFDRMMNATRRMGLMLDDLLQYSRVTTRGQPFSSVNLKEVIQETASDLRRELPETAGTVEMDELPRIQADENQMRLLFRNLLCNSLKFRKTEEPPRIFIRTGAQDNGTVEILVEDNGIGFDEQYRDRIFQPFQRLHARDEYPGTGMGLAICQKIVQRHRGKITAQSEPGKGSVFTVTLPKA